MKRRGEIFFYTAAFMGILFTSAFLTGILGRNDFRIKKANQICVSEGETPEGCQIKVSKMQKAQVLAYIKDTIEHPR